MEEKLKIWETEYNLKNLQLSGYRGGYPIIQFDKDEKMRLLTMSKREIDKVVKSAEIYGGIHLGVGYNLRKTAFVIVNNETIVICGHELVIERILKTLF